MREIRELIQGCGTAHAVLALFLSLLFLAVFAANIYVDGPAALPWDLEVLLGHATGPVSKTISIVFGIAVALILVAAALCLTGILLGPKRLPWALCLFAVNIAFAMTADIASYAALILAAPALAGAG